MKKKMFKTSDELEGKFELLSKVDSLSLKKKKLNVIFYIIFNIFGILKFDF